MSYSGKYRLLPKYKLLTKQLKAPPGSDLTSGRLPYPFMLKDRVKPKGSDTQPRMCITEMNVLFQCWSANDYDQVKCSAEALALMTCYNESVKEVADAKAGSGQLTAGMTELGKHQKLSSEQIGELLRKNPHPIPKDGKKYRK